MDNSSTPTIPEFNSTRPYVTLVYGYKNRMEQIQRFIANLPDRIGDRDWKIYLHDHGQGEACNTDCDLIEKVKNAD